jgi:hypothetical protein
MILMIFLDTVENNTYHATLGLVRLRVVIFRIPGLFYLGFFTLIARWAK